MPSDIYIVKWSDLYNSFLDWCNANDKDMQSIDKKNIKALFESNVFKSRDVVVGQGGR